MGVNSQLHALVTLPCERESLVTHWLGVCVAVEVVRMFRGAGKYLPVPGIKLHFLSHEVYSQVTKLTTLLIPSWTQDSVLLVAKPTIWRGPAPDPSTSLTASFSVSSVFPCPPFYKWFSHQDTVWISFLHYDQLFIVTYILLSY